MANIHINDQPLEVPNGCTILQAAEQANVEIPVFCYHSRLSIAGNCRMCLVEVKGAPKPVASCAMPVADNMVINTNSTLVQEARKGALEFLLINHPLDCPICDQGGECDLQDITMSYGSSNSRFFENKRAVKDKNMGPLIATSMNRCIHCTRCVRFAHDICGSQEMGLVNRGEHAEITTYFEGLLDSEMSGNVIDLCPVGALTSKPYAFSARSWELKKTESVDIMDAVGSSIRLDSRGMKILRTLPRLNEEINEEWISDKTRFSCDGLSSQRIDKPYIRNDEGLLEPSSWSNALSVIQDKLRFLKGKNIGGVVGDLTDCESMVMLKQLFDHLGSKNLDCRQSRYHIENQNRGSYVFNTSITGIEESDCCLMIGGNIRYDAPLINARLRKRYLRGNFSSARIGGSIDNHRKPTFFYEDLGPSIKTLHEIKTGNHPFAKVIEKSHNPMVIISEEALSHENGGYILNLVKNMTKSFSLIREGWNGFNILHNKASRVGALDLGIISSNDGLKGYNMTPENGIKALFLIGADDLKLKRSKDSPFTVYIGHHGDNGASVADVILPGVAYTEKNATYVNTEGRVQQTRKAVNSPGESMDDWKIILNICKNLSVKNLPETLEEIRTKMATINPVFNFIDTILENKLDESTVEENKFVQDSIFNLWKGNFFLDNVVSRNSQTMIRCAKAGGWLSNNNIDKE